MKNLFFIAILIFPFYMNAQTIHIDDGEVVYKGKISTGSTGVQAAKKFFEGNKDFDLTELKETDTAIIARASMRLNSHYPVIRKLHYSFTVIPDDKGYKYRIDSVSISEKERGGKRKTLSSKEVYKDMEESGVKSQRAEAVLNEIDMRFQKLIALLKNELTGSTQTK
jgi:hypothetical protein